MDKETQTTEHLMAVIRAMWPYVRRPPMVYEQPAFQQMIELVTTVDPELTKDC